MVSLSGGLCDLVPEVLDVAIPELSDLGLVGVASGAVNKAQALDFVEGFCVDIAGELRRRCGTKFIGTGEGEGCDFGPLDKVCGGEVGWG